ncbi:hypothetical protein [Mucilaginibacter sp.]|uniref:hypothetical protein n=1 Tax=Mucilaginibacter sp. TaxID=1882438 RepID=UPI00261CC828|nr:hypothetical protein [Mucilaginibacter sp.]MDB5126380.1 hypothetical protein [Mucilaginibacter sp.]
MKVNENPRISINKLGEYIYATPSRQRRILIEAKFPSEIITTRYAPVQKAAIEYFVASVKDIEIFNRVKEILSQKPTINDHQKEKVRSCIEALSHLTSCASSKLVPYIENPAIKGFKDCSSITINGVIISLRPEILLLDAITNQPKGAIKLVFSKGHFLTIQEGQCIAGLIKSYLEGALNINCYYKDCVTLDVFSDRLIYAPIKNAWTISKVENACDSIRSIWPSLQKRVA